MKVASSKKGFTSAVPMVADIDQNIRIKLGRKLSHLLRMEQQKMTVENTLAVLGWSMVVNFGILLIWVLAMKLMPNLTYRTQSLVTSISREDFDRIMYTMMGQFKLALLITHFGPYVALRIVFA